MLAGTKTQAPNQVMMKRHLNLIWLIVILGVVAAWRSQEPLTAGLVQPDEMYIQGISLGATRYEITRQWKDLGERGGLQVFHETKTDAQGREWDFLAAGFDQYDRVILLKGTDFSCSRAPLASWDDLKGMGVLPEFKIKTVPDWPDAEIVYYEDLGFFVLKVRSVAREFYLMAPEAAGTTWEAVNAANS